MTYDWFVVRVQGMRTAEYKWLLLNNIEVSETHPIPNSSRFVFPVTNAPAAMSFSTTVAVFGLKKPSKILDAHVVGSSFVQMLSFIAIQRPSKLDLGMPIS